MSNKLLLALACCLLAASACNIIYKQNIQQGNAIEQDKLNQLKLGMTMNQVAFLLGTPSIRDPFHHNRWDYMSSFSRRGGKPSTRLVTLKFENAVLNEMTGVDPDAPGETRSTQDSVKEKPGKEVAEQKSPAPVAAAEETPEKPVITAIDAPAAEDSELTTVTEKAPALHTAPPAVEEVIEDIETAEENPQTWIVQLGSFEAIENAQSLVTILKDAGFDASILNHQQPGSGTRYLVRIEGFDTRSEAEQQLALINTALDLGGFLVPPTH